MTDTDLKTVEAVERALLRLHQGLPAYQRGGHRLDMPDEVEDWLRTLLRLVKAQDAEVLRQRQRWARLREWAEPMESDSEIDLIYAKALREQMDAFDAEPR